MENKSPILNEIIDILNEGRKRILLYAQASLPQSQLEAFRKLVLDEMGKSGIEGKVMDIFERFGEKGRRGVESAAKRSENEN